MKTNLITKIFLCCVLVLGCFGEELKSEEKSSGWFFGVGAGAGYTQFLRGRDRYKPNEINSKHNTIAYNAAFKIGRSHQLDRILGLRYYYNLDVGINFGYLTQDLLDNKTYQYGLFLPSKFIL